MINKFLDKIVREISYRNKTGIVNLQNEDDIYILSEILTEWGWGDIKGELIQNLLEKEERTFKNPILNKEVEYTDEEGNPKKGKVGNLITQPKDTPARDAAEKVLPDEGTEQRKEINKELGGDEPENKPEDEKTQTDTDEDSQEQPEQGSAIDPNTKAGADYTDNLPPGDPASTKDEKYEFEEDDGTFDYYSTTVKLNKKLVKYLSDEDLKIAKNFQRDYDDFEKNPTKEKADRLIEKYQLRTNNGDPPKIYPGVISHSHRHIFNGNSASGSGTVKNRRMVKLINKHSNTGIPTASKSLKAGPSRPMGQVTKPKSSQFGNGRSSDEDAGVREIMNPKNNPSFDGMDRRYLKLYGPTDENGNLLVPSSEHVDKYLEQAIGGSLDEAISKAEELEKTMKLSPEVRNALVDYQNEQKDILEKYKGRLPSEEAAQELQTSWGKYTQRITNVDPKMAKSMIKNQAEVFIYTYELARGDEAYLPAHPTYPASDKIVRTKEGVTGERVTGISVKVGDDGSVKVMGFPSENQQMLRYHKDNKYRENTSSKPGERGYAIGLKDDVVDSDIEMDALLNESGMSEIIKDKSEYYKLLREYKEYMINLQNEENYYGKGPMNDETKEKLESKKREFVEKIEKLIDMGKLIEKCGEKNAKSLLRKSPGKLLQYINYSAASNTAGGIQGLASHSQRIESDGDVDMATKEFPNDCKELDFSIYREHESSRNGGLLVGVSHPDSADGEII